MDKIRNSRLKSTELLAGGTAEDMRGASLASLPSGSQQRRDVHTVRGTGLQRKTSFVPVVDNNQQPLMPTTSARARKWIKSGKATSFWKKGIFCVRLNQDIENIKIQPIAVGIDPGSKKEGFTIKSASHTYLNVQADAVTWVKDAIETRRMMRRSRRNRNTPCRKNRYNRSIGGLSPSTKARWQWKIRIAKWMSKLYPITVFVVEDIKAVSMKGKRKWNKSFSPLETGKKWFYEELSKIGLVITKQGYETAEMRNVAGLKKTSKKLSEVFEAHCVDSWVLANSYTGGHTAPDNKEILFITPLRLHRRQLHRLQPEQNGKRTIYGGTLSLGFKRGSLVKHKKLGLTYVGGFLKKGISLHRLSDGTRLCQNAKPSEIKFLAYSTWRAHFSVA